MERALDREELCNGFVLRIARTARRPSRGTLQKEEGSPCSPGVTAHDGGPWTHRQHSGRRRPRGDRKPELHSDPGNVGAACGPGPEWNVYGWHTHGDGHRAK